MTGGTASPLDHLIVVAHSLDQGVAWCEATLGITPGPGGKHALMGTHNRLFSVATPQFPSAYFEIIAIDREANYARPDWTKRWFDMDNSALQGSVRHQPQLVYAVAQVPDIAAARDRLARQGIDSGPVIPFSRASAHGLLQWHMAVRDDGQRLLDGALPAPIQWGSPHPGAAMAASGVTLLSLQLSHPEPQRLRQALAATGWDGLTPLPIATGSAGLQATLATPLGQVPLHSTVLNTPP